MSWWWKIILTANIFAAWLFVWFMATRGFQNGSTYSGVDLVTIVLTALGVILAALTIFLGVLALWGYSSLKGVAQEVAAKVAKATAEEVAGRTAREVLDQEGGQGGGDEYASGAADDNR